MKEAAEFCGFAQCPLQSWRAPPYRTHSNLFKLDVWEVKNKIHTEGKSCSGQNPNFFFKTTTCGIFESYFFLLPSIFLWGSVVQRTKCGLLMLEGFCSSLCFAKRCLCDLIEATSPKVHFLMWKSTADGFLWGSLRIFWSKLCRRLCWLSMQWKTLPDSCVLSFLFWWIRIPEFRKEATKSINSDSWSFKRLHCHSLSVY